MGPIGSPLKGGRLDKEYLWLGKESATLQCPLPHPLPLPRPLPGAVEGIGDELLSRSGPLPLFRPLVEEVKEATNKLLLWFPFLPCPLPIPLPHPLPLPLLCPLPLPRFLLTELSGI